nr:uncharacterized protein LOC124816316 [Hydra vulgaris]
MFNRQALSNAFNASRILASRAAATDLGKTAVDAANCDSFYHPHNSYLEIEGRLVKADGTAYADGDAITLANNGIMLLFERIEYRFFDQPVETINFPGIATTMLGLLKYPNDFQQSKALSQLWYKDNITAHELFLLRQSDDTAIFRAAGVAAGKVDITRISLMMKRATSSMIKENELGKIITLKEILDFGFRSRYLNKTNVAQNTSFDWNLGTKTTEKPRYILVEFNTPVPAGTVIFALIISDRIGKLTSNGNRFMFEY